MSSFQDEAAAFLAGEKTATKQLRWISKGHIDYQQARATVQVVDGRGNFGEMILTAHVTRHPRKYGFVLNFRGERILGLDVEPGRSHTNLTDLQTVTGTHWHKWPLMDAEPDDRVLPHKQWFEEFCRVANIIYPYQYTPPTHDIPDDEEPPEQGTLDYD